jgi:ssRNA-specific RNase YbeY (16S rRNA maturation enzyme)
LELFRVVVHGLLHLCGLVDKSADEAKNMREKEDFYLDLLVNPFVSRET